MIRRAGPEDAKAVYKLFFDENLNRSVTYEPMSSKEFEPIYIDLIGRIEIYLYEDDEVLGLVGVKKFYGKMDHVMNIGPVLVDLEAVGAGIGGKMIEFVSGLAKDVGVIRLQLTVNSENERAINFYKRLGFKVEGTLRSYLKVGGGLKDSFMMSKILDSDD